MRFFLFLSIVVGLPMLCLMAATSETTPQTNPVHISFEQDARPWKMQRTEEVGGQGLVEYYLGSENANQWSEVVTVQYFTFSGLESKQVYELFVQDLSNRVGADKLTQKVSYEKKSDLMAEWSVKGTEQDQSEWVRIFNKDNTMAIVRYTTKNPVATDHFSTWKDIIEKASL